MSDLNDESEATPLSVRLGSLSREHLLALLERLAGDSEAFAQRITADIERDVLPHNPVQALALAEQVIALDAPLMNRSLDDGIIGAVLEEACTLWLRSARAARVSGTLPSMNWEARVREVARQDGYGVRACLLRNAHMLFDAAELRAMAERLELQAARPTDMAVGSEPSQELSPARRRLSRSIVSARGADR
jgi:hypothetical protein